MGNIEPPPPYAVPPLTNDQAKIIHLGHETHPSPVERLEAAYCSRHLLTRDSNSRSPNDDILLEIRGRGRGRRRRRAPTFNSPNPIQPPTAPIAFLRLVANLQEVGFCTRPPKTAVGINTEDHDGVADLIEMPMAEAVKHGHGGT